MVTKFVPLPADSGGKQRSLAVLHRLADDGPVTLCAFDDGRADHGTLAELGVDVRAVRWRPRPWSALRVASATAGRFWDRRLADLVRTAARSQPPDVLQVEYLQMAPYAHGVDAALRVLDLHNLESGLLASQGRSTSGPGGVALRAEAALLRAHERRARRRFDLIALVSAKDADALPGRGGEILVCPNGVDRTKCLPMGNGRVAVFVALLAWAPNVDAARWLATEIWPLVRRRLPDAELRLVGRDPAPEVRSLQGPGVQVTGSVPDVTPHLAAARLALAPLRAGGGTRLKILQALAAGRAVVATTLGAEGLEDLVGHGVIVADGTERFAAAVADLIVDPDRCADLGRRGHVTVHDRYTWARTLAPWSERLPR